MNCRLSKSPQPRCTISQTKLASPNLSAVSYWHPDGIEVKEGLAPGGVPTVSTTGRRAVSGILASGIYTHTLSERLNGALRSPYLPKDKKFMDAAKNALGLALPTEPRTSAGKGDIVCLWMSPDQWLITCPRKAVDALCAAPGFEIAGECTVERIARLE